MKKVLLICLIALSIFLTNGQGANIKPEGQTVVNQWWQSLQTPGGNGVWAPAGQGDFQIVNVMQGKTNGDGGPNEVWCGSFSPAMKQSGDNADPLSFDYVIKNFIVVRQGDNWSIAAYPQSTGVGPIQEDFLHFSCTNWEKEYDMSDMDMRMSPAPAPSGAEDSCELCS